MTEKLWVNNHNYENDLVEIITSFYLTKSNEPELYELGEAAEIPMQNGEVYTYSATNYVKGNVEMKAKGDDKNSPKINLFWKMIYLEQDSYFGSLYDQAIQWFFSSQKSRHNTEDTAFIVEPDLKFDRNWANKIITDYIKDENLKKILIGLYKGIKTKLGINDGVNGWVDVPNGVWNPENHEAQWIELTLITTDNYEAMITLYLKPKK